MIDSDFEDNVEGEPVVIPAKARTAKARSPKADVVVAPDPTKHVGGETVASLRAYGSRKIILEHNDEIPPTGLFVAVNGVGYNIVPGKEVDVPIPVIAVLDNAVRSRPVVEEGRIVGYQDSLRFSYRNVN